MVYQFYVVYAYTTYTPLFHFSNVQIFSCSTSQFPNDQITSGLQGFGAERRTSSAAVKVLKQVKEAGCDAEVVQRVQDQLDRHVAG